MVDGANHHASPLDGDTGKARGIFTRRGRKRYTTAPAIADTINPANATFHITSQP
jgi:hypothetical protein